VTEQEEQRGQEVHGPQTNIRGDVHGSVLSGEFNAPITVGSAENHSASLNREELLEELNRESMARCAARWQAAGVPREQASALAADQSVGAPSPELCPSDEKPVLLLIGDFGAGKSLVGERLFQDAITKAQENVEFPVPVRLDARSCVGQLRESIEESARGMGNPHTQGATVIVDGADEAGVGPAAELLAEARVLAGTWPRTTVVVISRPLPVLGEVEESVQMPLLSETEAYEVVGHFAGRTISQGTALGWPESVRKSICRPLFAVLLGTYLQEQDASIPKSTGELLTRLVERSLGQTELGQASANQLLQHLAILSTDRGGGPVHTGEVISSRDERHLLLNSRLVIEQSGALSFPLPILTQWFAAQSLAAGKLTPSELASDIRRLEHWRYPLIIFVGAFGHDQVTEFLTVLASEHPAFTAEVVKESLVSWGLEESLPLPPLPECGHRIRTAMQAWVKGIGPLAQLIAPVCGDGSIFPIGLRMHETHLSAAWYRGDGEIAEVTELPSKAHYPSEKQFWLDWPTLRSSQPGRQSAWAWRWTLDELVDNLSRLLQDRALPVSKGPLAREAFWQAMLKFTGRGSMYRGGIQLDEIEEILAQLPPDFAVITIDKWTFPVDYIWAEVNRLREAGEEELHAPWPGPDVEIHRGHRIWEPYTREQVLARAKAVYAGALEGYQQLVDQWFPMLAPRLEKAATLPALLVGEVIVPPDQSKHEGMPHIRWYLEPLPYDSRSEVEIRFGESFAGFEADRELLRSLTGRVRSLRPETAGWISAAIRGEAVGMGPTPVTELVYNWIWDDLEKVSWVDGLL
jgi:hypothetical protein